MERVWVRRVAVFEYIFSCVVINEEDPNVIVAKFKDFDINDWQLKIVENFAHNFNQYHQLIATNLKSKWSYEQLDNLVKAVILEALAEFNVHQTDKAILIDQSLITIQRYGDPHLKKITNALLDKILSNKQL